MNSWLIHEIMHNPRIAAVIIAIIIYLFGGVSVILPTYVFRHIYFRRKAQEIIAREEKDLLSELRSAEEIIKTLRLEKAQHEVDTVARRRKEEEAKLFYRRSGDAMGW